MKIVDIADEVYRELSEPCDLSIPAISFWLRSNIGILNNLISTGYFVDGVTLEIYQKICDVDTEIGDDEKVIFKKLYMIHYYDIKVRAVLGAASTDSVQEVTSDGARVKKYNKNNLSKTYITAKKQEAEELSSLVHSYKISKSSPRQVAGDDTVPEQQNVRPDYNRYGGWEK